MKQAPGNMFNLCNSIFTNYFHDFDVYLLCINLLRFHTLPPRFSSLLNLFENTYNIIKRTIMIVLQKLIEYSRFLLWHVPSILPWKIGHLQSIQKYSLHYFITLSLEAMQNHWRPFFPAAPFIQANKGTFQRRNFWINFYSNQ